MDAQLIGYGLFHLYQHQLHRYSTRNLHCTSSNHLLNIRNMRIRLIYGEKISRYRKIQENGESSISNRLPGTILSMKSNNIDFAIAIEPTMTTSSLRMDFVLIYIAGQLNLHLSFSDVHCRDELKQQFFMQRKLDGLNSMPNICLIFYHMHLTLRYSGRLKRINNFADCVNDNFSCRFIVLHHTIFRLLSMKHYLSLLHLLSEMEIRQRMERYSNIDILREKSPRLEDHHATHMTGN